MPPECKEMAEQLSGMIHEILETFRLNLTAEPPKQTDVSKLPANLCEPCQLIALAHQITFSPDQPEHLLSVLPVDSFGKVVSNIHPNAASYTKVRGGRGTRSRSGKSGGYGSGNQTRTFERVSGISLIIWYSAASRFAASMRKRTRSYSSS